jgi:hypothetical protein
VDSALEDMTEWWLTQLERNHEMWLAVLGARGMGRDPEVEELLDDIEERARAGLVAYLSAQDPSQAPPELWAVVTAWQGLAEAVGVDWLRRGRITREQAKVLGARVIASPPEDAGTPATRRPATERSGRSLLM